MCFRTDTSLYQPWNTFMFIFMHINQSTTSFNHLFEHVLLYFDTVIFLLFFNQDCLSSSKFSCWKQTKTADKCGVKMVDDQIVMFYYKIISVKINNQAEMFSSLQALIASSSSSSPTGATWQWFSALTSSCWATHVIVSDVTAVLFSDTQTTNI